MDFLPPSLNSTTIAGLLAIIIFSYYLLKRSRVSLAKTAPIPVAAWPVQGRSQEDILGGPGCNKDILNIILKSIVYKIINFHISLYT